MKSQTGIEAAHPQTGGVCSASTCDLGNTAFHVSSFTFCLSHHAFHASPLTHLSQGLSHCPSSQAAAAIKAQMAIRHHMDNLLSWNGVLVMPTALGPPPALDSEIAPETRRRLVALGSIAGLCGLPQACSHPLALRTLCAFPCIHRAAGCRIAQFDTTSVVSVVVEARVVGITSRCDLQALRSHKPVSTLSSHC